MVEHVIDTEQGVKELVEAAQALSEGDFSQELGNYFQGELGELARHIEDLRKNLQSLSPEMASSVHLVPEASRGVVEISQQAETSVNSILELVDDMCTDQEKVAAILDRAERGDDTALDVSQLRQISDKSRTHLMSLMGYLSFQDVVRQRAEKVQTMIDEVEGKIGIMLAKFGISVEAMPVVESLDSAQVEALQAVDQDSIDGFGLAYAEYERP